MKISDVIFSWDLIISVLASALIYILFPVEVNNIFAKDLYGVGISVLSIIFSVYFAALAVIISSSEDEFVKFLKTKKFYDPLINIFKWTLGALFISLLYSLIVYLITSNYIYLNKENQSIWLFDLFIFLCMYSLISTGLSCKDALKYANYRSDYLSSIN